MSLTWPNPPSLFETTHLAEEDAGDGLLAAGPFTGAFTATFVGVSAITIDCHSWPYHGPETLLARAGAAIFGPATRGGAAGASMTV
jgi:hypothetical protein